MNRIQSYQWTLLWFTGNHQWNLNLNNLTLKRLKLTWEVSSKCSQQPSTGASAASACDHYTWSEHHTNTQVERLPTCDWGRDSTVRVGLASHGSSWSGCCVECEACLRPLLWRVESGRTVVTRGAEWPRMFATWRTPQRCLCPVPCAVVGFGRYLRCPSGYHGIQYCT